jgi:L-glutamine:2-deoxy-scyllo-inosose/3-amino-2,3-dideoxy-scyllo-inosose aminotransferase
MKEPGKLAILGGEPLRRRPWPPWPVVEEEDAQSLRRVLFSRRWSLGGAQEAAFGEEFLRFLGVSRGSLTANGTYGLRAALLAAGVEPGDKVIVPASSCVSPLAAVLAVGATPVFADADARTLCSEVAQVEPLIGGRTRAIVVVHAFGGMADVEALERLAAARGICLIEDCAQAHGARLDGRAAGTFGRFGVFSFQQTKLLPAGEGGFVACRETRDHLALLPRINMFLGPHDGVIPPKRLPGENGRITEFQAAVLRTQLARFPELHRRRTAAAKRLAQGLAEIPGLEPLVPDPARIESAWFSLVIRYHRHTFDGPPLFFLQQALLAEGLPVVPPFPPIYRAPQLAGLLQAHAAGERTLPWKEADPARFPVAERFHRREGVLLHHPLLLGDESDLKDILDIFLKVYEQRHALPRLAGE